MTTASKTETAECACIREMISIPKVTYITMVATALEGLRSPTERKLVEAHFFSQAKRRAGVKHPDGTLWGSMLCLAILRKRDTHNASITHCHLKVRASGICTVLSKLTSAQEVIEILTIAKYPRISPVKNFDPGHPVA